MVGIGGNKGFNQCSWVLCGDFNVDTHLKRSIFIEDIELMDLQLAGGNYTWRRGETHTTTARLDKFLFSEDWDSTFRNIKQSRVSMTEYGASGNLSTSVANLISSWNQN
ncbi:hypothetical protein H5410_002499 [Solanum commersonii]|uniref:Endonuclease/exonuclease/phosphatase domain-containing protein n=1 Tax=Solanum commersonii TaxID=4109 RepID=A0A9J6B237_SOLCO|nr:hypothetical protein H5410_002499 [Solanum commersonii]